MAEPTLTLNYWEVLEDIGDILGVKRAPVGNNLARVRRYIEDGYRKFLFPPPLTQDEAPHRWDFLTTSATLAITSAGGYDYDLPDDYGSMDGTFHMPLGTGRHDMELCSVAKINALRASTSYSGDPEYVAIRPLAFDNTVGHRYEALFYPTPSTSRTLLYQYNILLNKGLTVKEGPNVGVTSLNTTYTTLTDTATPATFQTDVAVGDKIILTDVTNATSKIYEIASITSQTVLELSSDAGAAETVTYEIFEPTLFPIGGAGFTDVIKTACMATAELQADREIGPYQHMFMLALAAAVRQDTANAPTSLGLNLDYADNQYSDRDSIDRVSGGVVGYP